MSAQWWEAAPLAGTQERWWEAAPLAEPPDFSDVRGGVTTTEEPPGYFARMGKVVSEAIPRGAASTLATGLHAGADFVDQTIQEPLRRVLRPLGMMADADPLGAARVADESLGVEREINAERQRVNAEIGGRPSWEQVAASPLEAAKQYSLHLANAGAESVPAFAAAVALRNPEFAAGVLGASAGAQTYTDMRADDIGRIDAARAGLANAAIEAGGEALGLPFVMGKAGRGSLMRAMAAEGGQEMPVQLAQQYVEDQTRGTETPFLEQLGDALDAGIVGAGMGAGGHGLSAGTAALARRPLSESVAEPFRPSVQRGEALAEQFLRDAAPPTAIDPAMIAAGNAALEAAPARPPGSVSRTGAGAYRVTSPAGDMEFDGPDARAQAAEFAVRTRAEAEASNAAPVAEQRAEPPLSAADAGTIIDRRLAALDDAATGALSRGEFAALRREGAELGARLRQHEEIVRTGVLPADPRARLRQEDIDTMSRRREDIHAALERSRTATGSAEQAAALRSRLDRVDSDAQLVALARRLRGPAPVPAASELGHAPQSTAPVEAPAPVAPAATATLAHSSGNAPSNPLTKLTEGGVGSSGGEQNEGARGNAPATERDAIGELPEQRVEAPALAAPSAVDVAAPTVEAANPEAVQAEIARPEGDASAPAEPLALDGVADADDPRTESAADHDRVASSMHELDSGALLIDQGHDYRVAKAGDDAFLIGPYSARGAKPRRVDRAGAEAFLREQYAQAPVEAAATPASSPVSADAVDQPAPSAAPLRSTGTKNAVTDAERAAAGRHPIVREAVKSNPETLGDAMRVLKDNPAAGEEAVRRLARDGAGSVSASDEALLLVHKTDLLNRRDAAAKTLADPKASEEAKEVARTKWNEVEAQITELDQAAVNAGREWGRMGQFRQRMLREDFTFDALERKERARLERPLTRSESDTIKAMAETIAAAQARVDALQARIANAESEGAFDDVLRTMRRPRRSRPALDALRSAANDARARLAAAPEVQSRRRQSGAVMSPSVLYDLAIIGAYHVANGAAKFSDWVAAMRADLGQAFDNMKADHPAIFKAAQKELEKPVRASASVAEVMGGIDLANVGAKDVRKLVEALVGEGMLGEPAVIAAAAERLELDPSDVRRLFVQGGPRAQPTLTETQAELRNLRKLVRLQNEIDRIQAGAPKPARGEPAPDSPAVSEKKRQLAELRKAMKPVRDPEVRYQEMRGEQIAGRIRELEDRIKAGDFAARPRVPRKLDAERQRAQFELDKVKEAFLRHQFNESLKSRSPLAKVFGTVGDAFNLARAVMTSFDLSAILRQGGFIAYGHPVRAAKSIGPSLRAFASARAEHAIKTEIEARPNAPLYKRYGLQLTGIGAGPLTQIEEAYASRWLEKMPGWTGMGLVRGSGRAYTAFLNKLRADSFDAMAAALALKDMPTEAEGKAIANYVNVATGRGKVGMKEQAAQTLNTVFFAPRLVASRFQLLAGQPLYAGSARTRNLIAQDYARFLLGVGVAIGLTAFALGEDDDEGKPLVSFDPRSADFLKIRIGKTYLDPMAGLAQVSVLLGRLATGETVTGAGAVKPLRHDWTLTDLRRALGADIPAHRMGKDGGLPFGSSDAAEVIGRFLRTKLAPVPGAIVNTLAGSNVIGEEVTLAGAATELVTPMSFQSIAEVMEAHGATKGAAITLLGLLGMGVQHRGTNEAREVRDALSAVDAAQADIRERLSAVPMDRWPDELEAAKKASAPLLEGIALGVYKRDGKYGKVGEFKRTDTGAPVLVFEGRDGEGSVLGELAGYPGWANGEPYTTEGVQDRVRNLGEIVNRLAGEGAITRAEAIKLTERVQLQLPAAQDLYNAVAKGSDGAAPLDRRMRDKLLTQVEFLRSAEEAAGAQVVMDAKKGEAPKYNAARTLVQRALEAEYPSRFN